MNKLSSILMPAHVVLLLFARRPSAIAWRITTVIVDAIKCFAFWTRAHISKKITEVKPSFAYGNAALAVIRKVFVIWICASLQHSVPAFISTCWRFTSRTIAVLCDWLISALLPYKLRQASAGFCPATFKFGGNNNCCSTAIAMTQPSCVRANGTVSSYDDQFSKSLSGNILSVMSSWHKKII